MGETKKTTETVKAKKNKKTPRIRFGVKLVFVLCFLFVLIGAGYYAYQSWLKFTEEKFQAFSALVTSEIINCAELTTLKYNYSEIVTLRKASLMGLAKSYSLVRFSGTVRAGIADMSAALIDISRDKKRISVVLPAADILSNDISAQDVFDESQNIFVPIRTGEVFAEIDAVRNRKIMELIDAGFLSESKNRNEQLVSRVLSALGFENIRVTSR